MQRSDFIRIFFLFHNNIKINNRFPYNPHNYSDQRNTIKNPINIDPNNSSIAYHMSLYHMNMMRPNFYEQNDKIQLPSDLPYYFGQANCM